MKEYFSGHRDAVKINEYLNRHAEDSAEFKIVYRIRTLGKKFVAGNLTMQEGKKIVNCCNAPTARQWRSSRRWEGRLFIGLCALLRNKGLFSLRWKRRYRMKLCIFRSASLCPVGRWRSCGISFSASGTHGGNIRWCIANGGCLHLSPRCGAG